MSRPGWDEYWMAFAVAAARRSTCLRRSVGCVLVGCHGDVLATGYNGVAAGQPHCNEAVARLEPVFAVHEDSPDFREVLEYPHACPGAGAPSGTMLDACLAMHAEANALVSCRAPFELASCYVTVSPCVPCAKMLLRTPCQRVVFLEEYAGSSGAVSMWKAAGREWVYLDHYT